MAPGGGGKGRGFIPKVEKMALVILPNSMRKKGVVEFRSYRDAC